LLREEVENDVNDVNVNRFEFEFICVEQQSEVLKVL
jgi:hypothetical protein